MKSIPIAYGRGTIEARIPEKNLAGILRIKPSTPLEHPMEEVRRKLIEPNGTAPLASIVAGKKSGCIVVCDITRPVPNEILLAPILQTLENAGLKPADILLLVATGMHRPSTPEEKLEMFGKTIVNRFPIVDHVATDEVAMAYLGQTSRDIPIWINRRYLDAEVKILTGLIEPHLMAGFSGGRKSICPGIAGEKTIGPWHSPRFLEHAQARGGVLDGNPVHEEQLEVARKAGCDFIVNTVIDHQRRILQVVAGDLESAHLEGVRFAKSHVADFVDKAVDVVVTGAAGYPLDATWYQAIKGIVGAMDILKPGGTIILAASCSEGLGCREFEEIAERFSTIDEFMDAIIAERFFILNQWQLEELGKALRRGRVKVVSDGLPAEVFRRFYVEPVPSLDGAIEDALAEYGPETSVAVMPEGPYVLACIEEGGRSTG